MGSRRLTNSSCIKTFTDKYYSDIGSRLSEAYLPMTVANDAVDSMEKTFCMLTIDTRHRNRLKNNSQMSPVAASSRRGDTTTLHAFNVGTPSSTTSDLTTAKVQETSPCWKVTFRKKLTRILFEKRHTCCRCKRRSRSCVRNKTFNGLEKHYTCCKCREASKAVTNLFCGKSNLVHSGCTNSSLRSMSTPENQHAVQQILVDACHKDSGYETATSCSTAASSCSTSTTPANSHLRINKPKVTVNGAVKNGPNLWAKSNTTVSTMREPRWKFDNQCITSSVNSKHETILSCAHSNNDIIRSYAHSNNDIIRSCAHSNNDIIRSRAQSKNEVMKSCVLSNNYMRSCALSNLPKSQIGLINRTTEVSNVLVTGLQNYPCGIIRQVNQRRIDEYDGYLPDVHTNKIFCYDGKDKTLSNATKFEASVQNDCCYKIIKLSASGKNTTSENKTCHTCDSTSSKVLFKLPWEGGFVCEDCLDRLH